MNAFDGSRLFTDRHHRNTDGERASFSFAFSESRDIASVKFDDGFRNREAHSQAALQARLSGLSLACKSLETIASSAFCTMTARYCGANCGRSAGGLDIEARTSLSQLDA